MDVESILIIAREITVTGLLALGVVALARGWVVTRWHYNEMIRQYEERLEEAGLPLQDLE